jgi:hypothetical protein
MQRGTTVLGVATPHALSSIQTCFSRQALPEMPSTRSTWRKLSVVTVRLLASVWSLLCAHFRITEFGAGEARKSAESFVGHVEQLLERLLRRRNAPLGHSWRLIRPIRVVWTSWALQRFPRLRKTYSQYWFVKPNRFFSGCVDYVSCRNTATVIALPPLSVPKAPLLRRARCGELAGGSVPGW